MRAATAHAWFQLSEVIQNAHRASFAALTSPPIALTHTHTHAHTNRRARHSSVFKVDSHVPRSVDNPAACAVPDIYGPFALHRCSGGTAAAAVRADLCARRARVRFFEYDDATGRTVGQIKAASGARRSHYHVMENMQACRLSNAFRRSLDRSAQRFIELCTHTGFDQFRAT